MLQPTHDVDAILCFKGDMSKGIRNLLVEMAITLSATDRHEPVTVQFQVEPEKDTLRPEFSRILRIEPLNVVQDRSGRVRVKLRRACHPSLRACPVVLKLRLMPLDGV